MREHAGTPLPPERGCAPCTRESARLHERVEEHEQAAVNLGQRAPLPRAPRRLALALAPHGRQRQQLCALGDHRADGAAHPAVQRGLLPPAAQDGASGLVTLSGFGNPDPGQSRAAPRAPRAAPPRRGASGHARPAPQHGRLPPPLGRARAAPPHSLLPHAERLRAVRVRRTERLSSAKPQQHATRASLRRLQHAAGGGKQAPGRQGLRRGRPAHRRGHDLQAGRMYAARARRTPAACLTPTRRAHRRCRQARRCGQRPPTPWRAPRHRLLLGGLPGRAPLHRLLVGEDAGLAGPDDMVRAKVHGHQHLLELRRARAPARRAACGGRAERACGTGGRGRRAPC
jgi:hypothetical protein